MVLYIQRNRLIAKSDQPGSRKGGEPWENVQNLAIPVHFPHLPSSSTCVGEGLECLLYYVHENHMYIHENTVIR